MGEAHKVRAVASRGMSQVTEFKCSICGANLESADALASHIRSHDVRTEQPQKPLERKRDLAKAYAHADKEFSLGRIPIFGVTLIFLLATSYMMAFRVANAFGVFLFAPVFVGAVLVTIAGLGFLFKVLLEG